MFHLMLNSLNFLPRSMVFLVFHVTSFYCVMMMASALCDIYVIHIDNR